MTNKEKYQKAFSTLHASDNISLEAEIMEKNKKLYRMKKVAAACAAVAVVFGSMTVAYASDLGGIRQKITAWFHGEQAQMDVTDNGDGSYSYKYVDDNGQTYEGSGGGVAIDDNGNEIPLTADELMKDVGNEVEKDQDGNVWLYYYDKKLNITDLFDKDGICKVTFEYEGRMVYFKIHEGDEIEGLPGNYGYECGMEKPEDAENYTILE